MSEAQDQIAAGREAADRLAHDWENRDWVPEDGTVEWASAAVQRLGEIIADQPSILRASMKGADKGASTLSPRPFQGLVECLQNADDLGASVLHVAYRGGKRAELLIVHDGSPVTLDNVGAMLLPWLSTKDDDPDAAGRFGIGQKTLNSLGGPLTLHASPFHFVMGAEGPTSCTPAKDIEGVYASKRRDTMLVIPLASTVTAESVIDAVRELNVDALIFLKTIRTLAFHDLDNPANNLVFSVQVTPAGEGAVHFGREEAIVTIANVKVRQPSSRKREWYRRYSTRRVVKGTEKRSNKATGTSTPLAVCVPMASARSLRLHDRMPLPISTGLTIGLDAQFDPDSARSTLQPNGWNRNRFSDLSQLVAWAALDAFAANASTAWNHVPLEAEVAQTDEWVEARVRELVSACQETLRKKLKIVTPVGPTAIEDLAYEAEDLEPILTEADVEHLRPGYIALPRSTRDAAGRWRRVLEELDQSDEVQLFDALDILDAVKREADWYIAFAVLAEANGLFDVFVVKRGILLADENVTAAPTESDAWVLVKNASPKSLAARLGIARLLHPAYLVPDAPTASFIERLETRKALFENRDATADVFSILGRGLWVAAGAPIRLADDDLLALRDAWESLPRDRHARLGPKVGQRVELRAIWYGQDGKLASGWARPVELYLHAAIDREVDSFAKAAAKTPDLKWVDPHYAKLLKNKAGRAAIGAQKLLSAWGVAREPHLIRPKDEEVLWVRDPRPASPVETSMRTSEQLRSIHSTSWISHLLDDHWSPDADAVARDIAKAPAKFRRKRAIALLATLSRGWERRYSEHATAKPAYAYNGYWHPSADVRATWLARLADVKWLPDAGNGLQRPIDLQMQAPGSTLRPNERSSTVARLDVHIQRSGILAALGVKAGPTQRDLVERLRALRKLPVTAAIAEEVLAAYQLLAASLRERGETVPEGRMTTAQLRNAFRASANEPGLLLIGKEWHSPETALRGPPIFGRRRAFAPHIEGLDALWKALGVESPSPTHAIAVLKEISEAAPSPDDLGVVIRALTLISNAVEGMSAQMRATLKRLPLWTGGEWTIERPVYALEGEALLTAAPPKMRVWKPNLTSFSAFAALLEPLGVVRLTPSDFQTVSTPAYGVAEGEQIRPAFARAVALLRQELVRADQALYDSLRIDWDDLLVAPVVIDPELSITAHLAIGSVTLPAVAHFGLEPLRFILRNEEDAGKSESGGAAIAALFDGDRQKAAWAWAAVWPRALAGEHAAGAVLPKTRAARGDGKERLDQLAKQAASRKVDKTNAKKPKTKDATFARQVQVRKLRELGELEPSAGAIVNEGAKSIGGFVFSKRGAAKERKFNSGLVGKGSNASSSARTVLPPSSDRETLALDAVRRALRLDVKQFNDLRDARGVGVDAIDELRQCYEIKMSSGTAMPTDVTLTASEIEAARVDPDFFLAIVTGLEDGAGELRVRFIFDPLAKLDVKVRSDLTLTGVDKAEALEFSFSRYIGEAALEGS